MKAAIVIFPGSNREHDVCARLEARDRHASRCGSGTATRNCPMPT